MSNLEGSQVYRLPAEWEKQEAVWFAWTTREDLWDGYLASVQKRLLELYQLCSNFQKVNILCSDKAQSELNQLLNLSAQKHEITLFPYETDDVWIRDFGPVFLKHNHTGRLISSDWIFNAWGEKFDLFEKDNAFPRWLSRVLDLENISHPYVLEGGALETNGEGILCTTKKVLNNSNRMIENKTMDWEAYFNQSLGVKSVLWFDEGLHNDDTDGHIDNLLRFAPGHQIIFASERNQENPNYLALSQIKSQLYAYAREELKDYKFHALPIPDPIYIDGEMASASYVNYLVLNGAVIVPCFEQDKDDEALSVIKGCFPDREVIGFNCLEIIREGGGLHCLSLNQPFVDSASE